MGNKKGQSISRQIKRGHVKGVINEMFGSVDFYRRTSNSRKHTVFIGQLDLKD